MAAITVPVRLSASHVLLAIFSRIASVWRSVRLLFLSTMELPVLAAASTEHTS